MGVPTSEVGYTAAMPRREDHEVHMDMWWYGTNKKFVFSEELSEISSKRIGIHVKYSLFLSEFNGT